MLLSFLAVLVLAGGRTSAESDPAAVALSTDIAAFAASLDADQRRTALYRFGDAERFDLRLAPLGLEGLRVDGMSEEQWQRLHGALGEVLSAEGLKKMDTVRSLEREVAETENGLFGWLMGGLRDARRYFLAVFGDPSSDLPWAMRFDGHHLSLNWTVVPQVPLSVTPLFFGGQPREVPAGLERAGLRVLEGEEDRALELIAMLSDDQRAAAELAFGGGGEFSRPMFVGAGANLSVGAPAGVAAAELEALQREALIHLLDVYLDNFVAPIAARHRSKILSQLPGVHFAYSGLVSDADVGLRAGDPLYYRVQGATFLIEFDNTSSEANHVHVVWREFDGDFGRDVLAEHYLKDRHSSTDD